MTFLVYNFRYYQRFKYGHSVVGHSLCVLLVANSVLRRSLGEFSLRVGDEISKWFYDNSRQTKGYSEKRSTLL